MRLEQGSRRRKLPQLPDEREKEDVKDLGQHFAYTGILWMHDAISTFNSVIEDDWDPMDRFANDQGIIQGQYRELIDFIPARWHDRMGDQLFINTVSSCLSSFSVH